MWRTFVPGLVLAISFLAAALVCAQQEPMKFDIDANGNLTPETLQRIYVDDAREFQREITESAARVNPSLVEVVTLMNRHSDFMKYLELTDEQVAKLEGIRQRFEPKIAEIEANTKDAKTDAELIHVKMAMRTEMVDVLIPHQLLELNKCNLNAVGMPKLLTDSPYGKVLELTDEQRKRIAQRSDEVAKKIKKMLDDVRQESIDVVWNELDEEQKQKLLADFGFEAVIDRAGRTDIGTMFKQYLYSRIETVCDCQSPSAAIQSSPVKVPAK